MRTTTIFKRPNGVYYLWYNDDAGKRQKISCHTKSKAESKAFRDKFIKGERKPKRTGAIGIKAYADQYILHSETNQKAKTAHNVRSCFNELLAYLNNNHRPLSSITTAEIQAFLDKKMRETSRATVRRHIITLRAAWGTAIRWGYLKDNPWTFVKKPKLPQQNPAWLNMRAFNNFLKYVILKVLVPDRRREESGQMGRRELEAIINRRTLYHLVGVAFNTGMRSAELRNLRFDSLDWPNQQILVKNEGEFVTKNYRQRVATMTAMAFEILKLRKNWIMVDEHDLVFPMLEAEQLRLMTESYVSHMFKKWATGAKLDPKLNLHSLRHSFASVLASGGVPLRTIQHLLGHQNSATTEVYAHLQKSELQSAVKLLDEARAKNDKEEGGGQA
jgi:integrase/recombinase XerC